MIKVKEWDIIIVVGIVLLCFIICSIRPLTSLLKYFWPFLREYVDATNLFNVLSSFNYLKEYTCSFFSGLTLISWYMMFCNIEIFLKISKKFEKCLAHKYKQIILKFCLNFWTHSFFKLPVITKYCPTCILPN